MMELIVKKLKPEAKLPTRGSALAAVFNRNKEKPFIFKFTNLIFFKCKTLWTI